MLTLKMQEIFKEETCIGGKASGKFFCNEVEIALSKGDVLIDFKGVNLITQSFSDEFLGPIVVNKGKDVFAHLKFSNCTHDIQAILTSTARRFLSNNHYVPA